MSDRRAKRRYHHAAPAPPARRKSSRRAVLGRVAPLLPPLLLVNAAAIWGQAGWAYSHVADPGWTDLARLVVAILFATAVESVGIFLAWEAHLAMMANQASGTLRAGSYLVGAFAGWMNWDHWHGAAAPDPDGGVDTRAAAFAGMSVASPILWAIWSRARNRRRLVELDLADERGLKLSINRKVWHPVKSYKLTRWAAWSGETRPAVAVAAWEASVNPSNHGTSGRVELTDELVGRLAQEAEDGYDVERLRPPPPARSSPKSSPKTRPKKEAVPTVAPAGPRAAQRQRVDEAARVYGSSVVAGAPLSAAELAAQFPPLSASWARKVIASVERGPAAIGSNGRAVTGAR